MKAIFKITFLFIISQSVVYAQNRNIEFEHTAWADVLAKAKKENKMIYVDCYTSWCGPCKWMAKNVFTNDTAADFYNANFVNAKVDMEKGEGIELAKKYDVRAYPTMLYLDANGVQLHRTCGSTLTQNFIANGKNALNIETQLATYTKKFSTTKVDANFAFTYFDMLENACQIYDAELVRYFDSENESNFISNENWKIINRFVEREDSKAFIYMEKYKEEFSKLYTTNAVDTKIIQVYRSGLFSAIQNKNKERFELLKTKFKNTNAKNADKTIAEADIKMVQNDKDWKKYAALVLNYVEQYSTNDAYELNSFAWSFYENIDDKALLEKAAGWAKHATSIEDNYALNDTYAALLFKIGNKAEAKKIAEKAIALAKKSGDDYKETQELLDKINAMK